MSGNYLKWLCILLSFQSVTGDFIVDNLQSYVSVYFKEIFKYIFLGLFEIIKWIFEIAFTVTKNTLISIVDSTKNEFEIFFKDVFYSFTSVRGSLAAAATNVLNELYLDMRINHTKDLVGLMYTGDLPLVYYLKKIDWKDEQKHMEDLIDLTEKTLLCGLTTITVCTILSLIFVCRYYSSRKKIIRIEKLKIKTMKHLEKYREKLKTSYEKKIVKKERQEQKKMELMKLFKP